MLSLRSVGLMLAFSSTGGCGLPDYVPPPEHGYLGSIKIDGPDVGRNEYGHVDSRDECSTDPSGATRLSFVVASRQVQLGRWRKTETQRGFVIVSAPGAEPHYEVDLPWSHMIFDAPMCSETKTAASVGPQNIDAGIAQINCADPERGDVLKIDVSYQGC